MKKIVINNQACSSINGGSATGARTLDFLDVWGDTPLVRSSCEPTSTSRAQAEILSMAARPGILQQRTAPVPANQPVYGFLRSKLVYWGLLAS